MDIYQRIASAEIGRASAEDWSKLHAIEEMTNPRVRERQWLMGLGLGSPRPLRLSESGRKLANVGRYANGRCVRMPTALSSCARIVAAPNAVSVSKGDALGKSDQHDHFRFVWDGVAIRTVYSFSGARALAGNEIFSEQPISRAAWSKVALLLN